MVSPRAGKAAEPASALLISSNRKIKGNQRDDVAPNRITPSQVKVKITDIECYEHNLRIMRHQKYEAIKGSIRARGLDQPFVITRRPGAEHYTTARGGNTRLKILKELYEETGDQRYLWQELKVQPWEGERTALIGHLVENELRANVSWYERARGVRIVKDNIADERGLEPSLAELADVLANEGYAVDRSTLSRMLYTIDVLSPVIPKALRGGAGQPVVREIRGLEKAADKVLARAVPAQAGSSTERRDEVFRTALERNDADEWDKDRFFDSLVELIAEDTGYAPRSVRLGLRGANSATQLDELFNVGLTDAQPVAPATPATTKARNVAEPPAPQQPASSVQALRAAHWTQAVELAAQVDLKERVVFWPDSGFGYLVNDIPPLRRLEQLEHIDPGAAQRVKAVWFHLLNLSGQLAGLEDASIARTAGEPLPPDSMLRAALQQRSIDALSDVCDAITSPGRWGVGLLGVLTDEDWVGVKSLERTFRSLLATVDRQRDLWGLTEEQ